MFLRGLIRIRADDLFARIVRAAVAPRGGCRGFVADAVRGPDIGKLARRVAAEIALIGPELLILIEVLREEQIERQRLHSRWRARKGRCGSAAQSSTSASSALGRLLRGRHVRHGASEDDEEPGSHWLTSGTEGFQNDTSADWRGQGSVSSSTSRSDRAPAST